MIKETKIKLNGIEYKVKRTNEALCYWEEMTGLSYEQLKGTLTHMLKYFYSVLVTENENFKFTYKEFVAMTNENPDAFPEFTDYLTTLAINQLDEAMPVKKKVTKNPTK
jgi:hypothetical protein